ncbi:MAG: manganese efflux pump MntP family protein [Candidatus Aminicenantes bacterium]|nr:manganese efflux pump MntP family protein [Candidatus Aminicenantes bacterium]
MDLISVILLAVGLSMDAVAVSISTCLTFKEIKIRHALRMALFFGVFQAAMPLIGWLAGAAFRGLIQGFDHWIAITLLGIIGGRMIYGSFKIDCETTPRNPMNLSTLLGLSVATSIDALAAGVSFGVLKMNILTVIAIIGFTTFLLSFIGTRIGKRVGCHFSGRMELLGGIILVGIGVRILIQHLANHI